MMRPLVRGGGAHGPAPKHSKAKGGGGRHHNKEVCSEKVLLCVRVLVVLVPPIALFWQDQLETRCLESHCGLPAEYWKKGPRRALLARKNEGKVAMKTRREGWKGGTKTRWTGKGPFALRPTARHEKGMEADNHLPILERVPGK